MTRSLHGKLGRLLLLVSVPALLAAAAGAGDAPASPDPATGADPAAESPTPAASPGDAAGDVPAQDVAAQDVAEPEPDPDPCRLAAEGSTPGTDTWLDNMREGIHLSVCSSARWFDGFFGDARFDNEAERTWGRLAVDTLWDRKDSFDADVLFRAQVEFPNLDRKLNAFLGRENEEDFIRGRNEGVESLPLFFRDTDEREWLVGLGYSPVGNAEDRLDFSVGVKVRFPLEPFVQGRYRHRWFLDDTRLVRFRNTAFWRNQHGFGDTVSLDYEQALGHRYLVRFANVGTISEVTQGVNWYSSVTLYQSLGGPRALSWTAYVDGETDRGAPIERYGLRTVYRQQMLRDWFFGQLIGGVNWPRDPGERRETSYEIGVGFEVRYGRPP